MKNEIRKIIHAVFRVSLFEKLLRSVVSGKYTYSFIAKFVPPNDTYPNPTNRLGERKSLILYANLHDYNDWKAYWGLKETERENLYKLVKDAEIVIDVGTNNGWVLMNIAAIIAKNDGFIYGFEPHPDTYHRCMANIERSGITNCKVVNMGCGEIETELPMETVLESNSGQNRIIENNEEIRNENIVKVNVARLDKQLGDLKKIDLIKIDVEGFELYVLKGADALLRRHKPVLFIEIDDSLLRDNKTSPAELLDFLKTHHNYTVKNAANLQVINDTDNLRNCHIDVICYPSGENKIFLQ